MAEGRQATSGDRERANSPVDSRDDDLTPEQVDDLMYAHEYGYAGDGFGHGGLFS